jgi:hypothetical protein
MTPFERSIWDHMSVSERVKANALALGKVLTQDDMGALRSLFSDKSLSMQVLHFVFALVESVDDAVLPWLWNALVRDERFHTYQVIDGATLLKRHENCYESHLLLVLALLWLDDWTDDDEVVRFEPLARVGKVFVPGTKVQEFNSAFVLELFTHWFLDKWSNHNDCFLQHVVEDDRHEMWSDLKTCLVKQDPYDFLFELDCLSAHVAHERLSELDNLLAHIISSAPMVVENKAETS